MKTKLLKQNDYFKSPDLNLATTLRYFGYQIEAIDKQNPSKAIFLIKRDEDLDILIQQYWNHELKVDPLSFFNCLKEVKAMLYNN